jgi:hypothetical protein
MREVVTEPTDFHLDPLEFPQMIATRVAISSAAIIGVWLIGSIAVPTVLRRRPTRS